MDKMDREVSQEEMERMLVEAGFERVIQPDGTEYIYAREWARATVYLSDTDPAEDEMWICCQEEYDDDGWCNVYNCDILYPREIPGVIAWVDAANRKARERAKIMRRWDKE